MMKDNSYPKNNRNYADFDWPTYGEERNALTSVECDEVLIDPAPVTTYREDYSLVDGPRVRKQLTPRPAEIPSPVNEITPTSAANRSNRPRRVRD